MSSKSLIVVRHAHRSKYWGDDADNGLSPKGKKQAVRIRRMYKKRYQDASALLVSSPKKRCLETLEPLAKKLSREIRIDPLLDEGPQLRTRVKRFLKWWRMEAPALTVACSHGDWIPELFKEVSGGGILLDKGGWAEIELDGDGEDDRPELRWILQDLDL